MPDPHTPRAERPVRKKNRLSPISVLAAGLLAAYLQQRSKEEAMQGKRTHRMIAVVSVFLGSLVTSSATHASDAVLEWNQIALAATVTAAQGPLPQIRSMAIVQVSVHDAVNAITREYHTYLRHGRAPFGASADAAAI